MSTSGSCEYKPSDTTERKDYTSCPYSKEQDVDPRNNMPPPNQQPAPGQQIPLSTDRETSNIPTGDEDGKKWIYPSEQMFFNAMRRKNWKPEERDMRSIVQIHNAVNERCWSEILKWEKMHERLAI